MTVLAASLPFALGCEKGDAPIDESADTRQRLLGTWRETGGQAREYVFREGGDFSLHMAACPDAEGGHVIAASGRWSVATTGPDRKRYLVLEVTSTSEPILSGSKMTDVIQRFDGTALDLVTSFAPCGVQDVRLSNL
jgi:hypothetical protein